MIKHNCSTCQHNMFKKCEKLTNNRDYKAVATDEVTSTGSYFERLSKEKAIENKFCCDNYKSMYIEYPIVIKKIENTKLEYNKASFGREVGTLVTIRPCDDNKSYLGILLGNLPTEVCSSLNRKTRILTLEHLTNPAIYVPALKKVVFGYESWWKVIQSEEELKDITDSDIDNVWYNKLLKEMTKQTED